ncbi:hypothetical protein [Marinobacter sp.]|uniref:hypothetical protein n=1 Tax=Marinobacter sp. TaxID=50741 RepID=UPI002B270BB9|nr:hypothetical protein [Marinobacter sp.]
MRALAQYVMRGPMQAGGVAVVSTIVPLLFWIGAAVTALVIMRQGIRQGLTIGLWAVLPALGWAVYGQNPTALFVLLQTMLIASVFRTSLSWENALLSGAFLTILSGLMMPVMYSALLNELVQIGVDFYDQYNAEVVQSLGSDLERIIRSAMSASIAGSAFAVAIAMAMLARSWQAGLDNPGGFQREFHAFRLSPAIAVVCAVTMVSGSLLELNPVLLAWAAGTPLLVAGLALVHGVVGRKRWGGQALFAFYIVLGLLGLNLMMLLLVLAFVDSWLDIRKRIAPTGPAE